MQTAVSVSAGSTVKMVDEAGDRFVDGIILRLRPRRLNAIRARDMSPDLCLGDAIPHRHCDGINLKVTAAAGGELIFYKSPGLVTPNTSKNIEFLISRQRSTRFCRTQRRFLVATSIFRRILLKRLTSASVTFTIVLSCIFNIYIYIYIYIYMCVCVCVCVRVYVYTHLISLL